MPSPSRADDFIDCLFPFAERPEIRGPVRHIAYVQGLAKLPTDKWRIMSLFTTALYQTPVIGTDHWFAPQPQAPGARLRSLGFRAIRRAVAVATVPVPVSRAHRDRNYPA